MPTTLLRFVRRSATFVPLAKAYTGRANAFGVLRLSFALAVVLAHAAVLGFNKALPVRVDIPGLAVAGFFGISGFLITRSARRTSLPRYLWHRAVRIWPGLWVCLLVTALVVAPLVWWADHGTLHGIWRHRLGVFNYLQANWWGGHRQGAIRDVFAHNPYRRPLINGSLWTLAYEITCYLLVAVVAAVGILRRARWLVLAAAVLVFGVLVWNRTGHPGIWTVGYLPELPLLGALSKHWMLWYGFMFLAGAAAELYADRLPMNDLLGVAAVAVVGWSTWRGELFGPGLLAYEYVILWAAVRLPSTLHWVGRAETSSPGRRLLTGDYSYGIYIYAFPIQQLAARVGIPAAGWWVYLATTAAASIAAAVISWHLVERPALRLKDWTPVPTRPETTAVDVAPNPEPATVGS